VFLCLPAERRGGEWCESVEVEEKCQNEESRGEEKRGEETRGDERRGEEGGQGHTFKQPQPRSNSPGAAVAPAATCCRVERPAIVMTVCGGRSSRRSKED